jgi:hypothetical protein
MSAEITDATIHSFFSSGCQYYIAGRYAAFAGFAPVVGNVLHHAVENFLKGGLSKTKTLRELKNLGHNLPAIWAAFKAQVNDPGLAQFDRVISTLHEFEELRYPDSVVADGMVCRINISKAAVADMKKAAAASTSATSLLPMPPGYDLCLEEIDELVGAVFVAASRSPKAYLGSLNKPEAKKYLVKDNSVTALASA